MTTLEKAAKAVEAEMDQLGYIPHDTEAFARAAIEAVREPSEEALLAWRAAFFAPNPSDELDPIRWGWQAMIDHILNEEAS